MLKMWLSLEMHAPKTEEILFLRQWLLVSL